jgi:hypothetical protein
MPRNVPVQELMDLVRRRFGIPSNGFIGIAQSRFNDRLDRLLIKPAKSSCEVAKADHGIGPNPGIGMRAQPYAERLGRGNIDGCKGQSEGHQLQFLRIVPQERVFHVGISELLKVIEPGHGVMIQQEEQGVKEVY